MDSFSHTVPNRISKQTLSLFSYEHFRVRELFSIGEEGTLIYGSLHPLTDVNLRNILNVCTFIAVNSYTPLGTVFSTPTRHQGSPEFRSKRIREREFII